SKALGSPGFDYAFGTRFDGAGDIVMAGDFSGTMNPGGGDLVAAGVDTSDIFLARFKGLDGAATAQGGPFGDADEDWVNTAEYDATNNRLVVAGQYKLGLDFKDASPMTTLSFWGMYVTSFQF
ncbi:hypothetical protein JYT28_01655, partial [Desulfobulbus sp. AH-315-M07]|nr:hypothetical protein [Desulfobulbus sp. AH-315-M07]